MSKKLYKRLVKQIPTMSSMEIKLYSASYVSLWFNNRIYSFDFPKAFALLRYGDIRNHPNFELLMIGAIECFVYNRNGAYPTLSEEAQQMFVARVHAALEPFEHIRDWFQLIPVSDKWYEDIQPFYQAQFIFRKDPEGSIDLRAFANDEESVHRSSTQSMITESLAIVLTYPLTNQDTLAEIQDVVSCPWNQLEADYHTLTISLYAQTVTYRDVLDHVWAFIKRHEHREDLCRRLGEELSDSVGVCANGRLARLLNTLQGYDLSLPCAESFQDRFARLRPLAISEQAIQAQALFEEFQIPQEQQGAWLQALVE
jgi:hypothetical protein